MAGIADLPRDVLNAVKVPNFGNQRVTKWNSFAQTTTISNNGTMRIGSDVLRKYYGELRRLLAKS